MLFLWFFHACRRGSPRFLMVSDHINYLTFEDPGAVHTVRRALKLAEAGDLYGAAETAGVDVSHAAVVSQGLRRGMRFSIGAEVDNDPRARPDAQNIVDAMRPDGIIRSVHFLTIEHPEKGPDYQWAFDNPEFRDLYEVIGTQRVWELYMAKLLDDIDKLPGHIVGHFYVPANFGHWPEAAKMSAYEDQLLDACAARGMAVEINTRYLYRDNPPELKEKYREALARLMRKAKAKNVGIAIGSDAHSPKDQGNGFAEMLQMLDANEINEIVFPVNGRLARVALRATKEHLQKVKSAEPAPQPGSSISGFGRAELGLPERDEAQEVRDAAASKAAASARKRAATAARTTKKSAKATAEREVKAAKPDGEPAEPTAAKTSAKSAAKAPAKALKAAPAKAEPKPVKAGNGAVKAKPAAAAAAKPAAKTPAAKAPAAKAAAAKAPSAKPAAKPAAKTAAKAAAKAPAKVAAKSVKTVKAAAKKAPAKAAAVKKTATATAKKPAAKKAAPKKAAPAKKAAPKKVAAAKRKVSTPKRAATKKKTSTKRR